MMPSRSASAVLVLCLAFVGAAVQAQFTFPVTPQALPSCTATLFADRVRHTSPGGRIGCRTTAADFYFRPEPATVPGFARIDRQPETPAEALNFELVDCSQAPIKVGPFSVTSTSLLFCARISLGTTGVYACPKETVSTTTKQGLTSTSSDYDLIKCPADAAKHVWAIHRSPEAGQIMIVSRMRASGNTFAWVYEGLDATCPQTTSFWTRVVGISDQDSSYVTPRKYWNVQTSTCPTTR